MAASPSNKTPKKKLELARPAAQPALGSMVSRSEFHVLLIEEDPSQSELYSDLIREVAQCKVDVISQFESSFDWIARSNYHLVVVDTSAKENGLRLLEQI